MIYLFPILLGFALSSPAPDLVAPGFKKVQLQIAIENPDEFGDWLFVAATHLGPAHVTVVKAGEPCPYSAKYGTILYALPAGTEVPRAQANRIVPESAFDGFLAASPPVSSPSSVSVLSPIERILTTIRITNISEAGIRLEEVAVHEFDIRGRPVHGYRVWAIPGAIAISAAVGLYLLRRRRIRRARG